MRVNTRVIILLAIIASLFSFAKFSHCESSVWAGPDQYIHACYSDFPALFSERAFGKGEWAFSGGDQAVEYPVLQGVVMWATAKVSPDGPVSYFNFSAILIALLFIASSYLVYRIKPDNALLYTLAPTGALSLFINWDLWAIVTTLLAIYWFDRKQDLASAAILGVSIATKFFPVVLLLPILIILIRREEIKKAITYLAISLGTFIAINIPFALTTPTGWWRFYDLNLHREADWGSLWYALSVFGVNLNHINYLAILTLLIGITVVAIFLLQTREILTLAESSLFIFIVLMTVSKVYSPQYVLWLTPLAVLALRDKRDLSWFWGWQIAEVIYHFAIWQHLALLTGAHFGLPVKAYAVATVLRIVAALAMAIAFARRHRSAGLLEAQRWPELPL
ncbi:COG5650 Predicted integral membrane protein [Candidatus Nanopelagicaceae bacterium]